MQGQNCEYAAPMKLSHLQIFALEDVYLSLSELALNSSKHLGRAEFPVKERTYGKPVRTKIRNSTDCENGFAYVFQRPKHLALFFILYEGNHANGMVSGKKPDVVKHPHAAAMHMQHWSICCQYEDVHGF